MPLDVETILKVICPNPDCHSVNFIPMGDSTDLTASEPAGFVCYACQKKHLFDEEEHKAYMWDKTDFETFADYVEHACTFEDGKASIS